MGVVIGPGSVHGKGIVQRRSTTTQYGINVACLEGISPFDFAEVPVLDGVNHPADSTPRREGQVGFLRYVAAD